MSKSSFVPNPAKILIVDDNLQNLNLLSDTLAANQWEVKGVANGEMAFNAVESFHPDLILLDIKMPDMDGYEVCAKLKEDPVTKDIPIIFLSASNDPMERIKALEIGGVDYIEKPFQINEVLLRIKNQLALQVARQEIEKLNTELEQRIQERQEVTKLFQASEEKLESILNSLEEVVWSVDLATNNLLFLNPAAESVYGRSIAELFAAPDLRLDSIHVQDRDRIQVSLANSLNRSNSLEYRIVQPDGEIRWVWERSRLVLDQLGKPARRDCIISDITERKKVEEELNYEAKHDSLTGLPNRAAFIERIESALKKSHQDHIYEFAVLFIDLDRFKVINDSLGHLIGDELLITVARILTDCCNSSDFVARLGGDEFTILLNTIETIDEASTIADQIQEQLQDSFCFQGHTVFTSASIGIVMGNSRYQDISEILRDSDIAMYRAKARGKARYEVFDQEMYAETKELLEIENDLRRAIKRREFKIYYQPIIAFENNRLYGFEALIRWQHKTKGLIYPSKFIHVAEETGLIIDIGEWILQEACYQLSLWRLKYPGAEELKISVNVASQQIKDPGFLTRLDSILEATNLSGHALNLEITESALMENKSATVDLFNQIRSRGIQLNIDDFGTGYSSLQYLHRFPINTLKIDRSFIEGMLTERENFEIVKMVISLARTLKIDVIAEGVENLKQLKVLKTFNCKLGQGHLFSEALEREAAELLIDQS